MTRSVPREVMEVAAGVAAELRGYSGYVDRSDLLQEAAVWALERPRKVQTYLRLEEHELRAVVATALRRRLRRYAERQKAEALGHETHGPGRHCSADHLRDLLLPRLWNREDWAAPPQDWQGGNGRQAGRVEAWMSDLADAADAFHRLPAEDRDLVLLRWRDQMTRSAIAKALDVDEATVSTRLNVAVDRMAALLAAGRDE